MITEQEFVRIIDDLKEANDIKEKIREIYRNARDNVRYDYMNAGSLMIAHEDNIVFLLEKIFGLGRDNTLQYWLYECDYGKEFEIGWIEEPDGTKPDLTTASNLYYYLLKEGEEYDKQRREQKA
jgi:hypothetical protein